MTTMGLIATDIGLLAATEGIGLSGWIVVIVYMLGVVVMGSWFVKGQRDTADYFLGGRTFGWLPVAISILVSNLSAISYIACASWIYSRDWRLSISIFTGAIQCVIGARLFLGLFRELNLFTLYEYLERRFNVLVRMVGSILFLIKRVAWLSVLLYGASLTLSVVMSVPLEPSIIIVGALATLYTALGGMKAVIWTDVVQFVVLVGGALLAIVVATGELNWDIGEIIRIADAGDKFVPITFSFDFQEDVTWFVIMVALVPGIFESLGADQVIVQRALSAKSSKDSVRAGMAKGLLGVPTMALLYGLGIVLYAYYQTHPEMITSLEALKSEQFKNVSDAVLPLYIVKRLPGWIAGLIVSAVFAATMSSVDSGINSVTCVCVMDYYRRFFHKPHKTERHYLNVSRWVVVFWGAVATVCSVLVARAPDLGPIMKKLPEIAGPYMGGMLGIFALAILTRRADTPGTLLGVLCSIISVLLCKEHVSFRWYAPIGFFVTLAIGYLFSILGPALGLWRPANKDKITPYTMYYRKAKPAPADDRT